MSSAIQAIHVRGHEDRPTPKPHVVYKIEIQAHVRTWFVWRRYSEFDELHTELMSETGAAPPEPLPPKHTLSSFLRSTSHNEKVLQERKDGLERYLRAILSAREEKWRESLVFRTFIGVPTTSRESSTLIGDGSSSSSSSGGTAFSSATWLDEHLDLQARVRDVRAEVNRRDALSDAGDINGSHKANIEAKKRLAAILTRLGRLEEGLDQLALGGLQQGELLRRRDMVARLRDECQTLSRMLTIARHTSRALGASSNGMDVAPDSDRAVLLGPQAAASSSSASSASSSLKKPVRVFGAKQPPAQETNETRPLDNMGVYQLQQEQMRQQDEQLAAITTVLQREKMMGVAIHTEIKEQNDLLDSLTTDVDNTQAKLAKAKTQLNRLG